MGLTFLLLILCGVTILVALIIAVIVAWMLNRQRSDQ